MTEQTTTVIRIDLVYDRDCPNVERARAAIRAALRESGADAGCAEWDRDSSVTPPELRHYGSPTVLVNGKPLARLGDQVATCNDPVDAPTSVISGGSPDVMVA